MAGYVGSNGKAQNLIGGWVGVNGKACKIVNGWVGVNGKARRIWTSTGWRRLSDSPINGYNGAACVFQNKIHLIDSSGNHYSFDGSAWTQETSVPVSGNSPILVEYNGAMHYLNGTVGIAKHYSWDGTSWTLVGNNPAYLYGMNNACVYNNKLTVVSSRHGSSGLFRNIWQYDGAWTNVTTAYVNSESSYASHSCCVYNGNIEYIYTSNNHKRRIHWDGTDKTQLADMPYAFYNGMMLEYDGAIHFIGSEDYGTAWGGDFRKNHYKWDGSTYTEVATLPYNVANAPAVVFNNKIYLFGSSVTGGAKYVSVFG